MSEVLEQRVNEVEKTVIRLGQKMDRYGEDSHENLTRLEDWLIQYSIENQKAIEESRRGRELDRRENEQGFAQLRKSLADSKQDMADSQQRTEQGFVELRKSLADSQQRTEQGFQELRKDLADSQQRTEQGFQELRKDLADSQLRSDQGFAELRKKIADSDQKIEKSQLRSDQGFAELRKKIADSDQKMVESQQTNDQGFAELRKSLADSKQRNDEGFAELRKKIADSDQKMLESQQTNDQGFAELRKKIADSRKELGQISHRLGTIVEDLVAPSLPRVFRELVNCPADEDVLINVRVRRRHPTQKGSMLEIDAMADCGNYVLFNETKSQFSPEKVKAFLKKLAVVRDYFPEYQSYQIRGCIASLYLDKSLVEYASRQGLLALASGEYLMTVQNDAGFSWKAF
jgi:bifunctional DNA-binding transcriptional regulator/antitoxin component of YhaV-PrlF toxin-antitoxin module